METKKRGAVHKGSTWKGEGERADRKENLIQVGGGGKVVNSCQGDPRSQKRRPINIGGKRRRSKGPIPDSTGNQEEDTKGEEIVQAPKAWQVAIKPKKKLKKKGKK